MASEKSHYEEIQGWMKLISQHPKSNRFFFLENEDACIINGRMIKLYTLDIKSYEQIYFHINVKTKVARYVAFNVDFNNHSMKGERADGIIPWNEIEWSLMMFFAANSSRLTSSASVLSESRNTSDTASSSYQANINKSYLPTTQTSSTDYYKSTSTGYDSEGYKERDAIRTKFEALIKEHKIANAIDHISSEILRMIKEHKIDSLNFLLISINNIDSMPVPLLLSMLKVLRPYNQELREHAMFFSRTKARLDKYSHPKFSRLVNAIKLPEPQSANPN